MLLCCADTGGRQGHALQCSAGLHQHHESGLALRALMLKRFTTESVSHYAAELQLLNEPMATQPQLTLHCADAQRQSAIIACPDSC